MHILDSVTIEGLWRPSTSTIKFKVDQNFNFLIGQNGTGKTTVINLIAAALDADFERLDKITFSRVLLTLKKKKGSKKPSIEVLKKPKSDVPYYDIEYRIKESASERPKIYDLDAFAEEQFYRGYPPRAIRERFYREQSADIQKHLKSLVDLCWLSVHRYNEDQRLTDERKYMPAVDQKLASLNTEFLKYFSQLSRNYAEMTNEFQKNSFLSLLTSERETRLLSFARNLNIEGERETLANVFKILGVEYSLLEDRLNTHFHHFETAINSWSETSSLTTSSFAAIYNALKTHNLVQHYNALETKRKEIFKPRDNFFALLNKLFDGRKSISISERNELIIRTPDSRQIPIGELSSGEKQLLIILGEALLQESASVVYIADEPELSLHVKWQEYLTNAIAELNPNAQIIFATHSPDIVSTRTDKIINMESLLG